MAKSIATIGGPGLRPGVSKNRRWYKPEHIVQAVAVAQERIRSGAEPMVMLTSHGDGDASRQIAASLTGVSLDEEGQLRWTAGIADTEAGRDIASLVNTSDGKPPHLKGVSIRGYWTGTVRKVKGPDGEPVETADGIEIDGLDFTKSPGVTGAEVDTFAWAGSGRTETTERVLITESVREARVTAITEETPAAEGGDAPGDGSKPYGNVVYADPGYQADKKKRYPLSSPAKIRSAWSYINQKDNAAKYTAAQLKRIKGKIKAAMKRIGAKVTSEGWVIWPPEQVAESAEVREWYGDGGMSGSFSVCATNGPLNVSVSSYCVDPADLDLILRAAADAACAAMKLIDPDMDGDMDIPGADAEDDDGDAGESAPQGQVTETAKPPGEPAGNQGPAEGAGPQTETEVPAMADTATAPAAEAPAAATETAPSAAVAPSVTLTAEQFAQLIAPRTAEAAPAVPAAEAAPAAPAAPAVSADDRIARIVAEQVAARMRDIAPAPAAQPAPPVAETEDQRIARLVEAGVREAQQRLVASGQVDLGRKGIVTPASAGPGGAAATGFNEHGQPAGWPDKPLHKYTQEELEKHAGPVFDHYYMKDKAVTELP